MGKRSRMNRANKGAMTSSEIDAGIQEIIDGMKAMAQDKLDREKAKIRSQGATDESIVGIQNATRLMLIAEVQGMDLMAMIGDMTDREIEEGGGLTNKIVEVLMEGLIPEDNRG